MVHPLWPESATGPAPPQVCPPAPASTHARDLGFVRKCMVRWLDPGQLVGTGVRTLLAGIFGAYADRREFEATSTPAGQHDYSNEPEIWIDYVSDLGDGWNSTFSVASLLARKSLPLAGSRGTYETRRGRLLIFGGDAVYPTPHRHEYRDRLEGPYTAALPCVVDGPPPHLFAIPGNHDWYDGLTGFSRLFFQRRWIGGWQTQQSRSYFAIRLPLGWWLWGVDFQLTADVDWPQLEYFRSVAERIQEGDRIILCTPEPSWVYFSTRGERAYQNLAFFERNVIAPSKHPIALNLAGDLHHYCRYEASAGEQQKITSGGGGAYLSPTYRMPETLTLPSEPVSATIPARKVGGSVEYRRRATYPPVGHSRAQRFQAVLRIPRNWRLDLMLAGVYLLFVWMLENASHRGGAGLLQTIARLPLTPSSLEPVAREIFGALAFSPGSVAFAAVLVFGLQGWASSEPQRPRSWTTIGHFVAGPLHALAHITLAMILAWVVAATVLRLAIAASWQPFWFTFGMAALGGLLGSLLLGCYLIASSLVFQLHDNELFSSQGIEDYKNFLRIHISGDGALTIYPVKVEKVARSWRLNSSASGGEPWFVPSVDLRGELIEEPIHLPPPRASSSTSL
jgi:hypothetical protein